MKIYQACFTPFIPTIYFQDSYNYFQIELYGLFDDRNLLLNKPMIYIFKWWYSKPYESSFLNMLDTQNMKSTAIQYLFETNSLFPLVFVFF